MINHESKHIHRSRQFYNSNLNEKKLLAEIQAGYNDCGVWLPRANAFPNKLIIALMLQLPSKEKQ